MNRASGPGTIEPLDPLSDQGLGPDRALMEAVVLASPDAVVVVDAGGTIHTATPAVRALFGYEPAELAGQAVEVLIPEPFRSAHVGHRAAYGVDPHARPMGAGLALEGRHKDGSRFPIDVALAPVELDGRRWVGAFVRDVTERRRAEAVLEYANEVNQAMLSDGVVQETLALIANRARHLAGATTAWIKVPSAFGRLVVAAADGEGTDGLVGAEVPAGQGASGRAMAERSTVAVVDMSGDPDVMAEARALGVGLGPGMYVPMAGEVVLGILVLARGHGQDPFSREEASVAGVFAKAAGVALSLGRARAEVEELHLAAEHDRIARDLHDTVIQRLFALGMGLQGALGLAPAPVAERISTAVDALDEVIREIRETIFDLQQRPLARGIRDLLREVLEEAGDQLGFTPALSVRGPVDAAVTEAVAPHLLAVVREALSNVARHARATRAEVVLEAGPDAVAVRVSDDGVGTPGRPSRGHGLANMAARAGELGGSFRIGPGPLGGTLVEWQVEPR